MQTIKKFFAFIGRHPFIITIISMVIGFTEISNATKSNAGIVGLEASFFIMILPVIVMLSWLFRKRLSRTKISPAQQQAQIQATKEYIDNAVASGKGFPSVPVSFFLRENEYGILVEEKSKLREPRSVRNYQGGGVGVRVMRGVWVGSSGGQSQSTQQWQLLDTGKLTLTNKRIVFDGFKERRTIEIQNIDQIKRWLDAVEVIAINKTKSMLFTVSNPYLWEAIVRGIRQTKTGKTPSTPITNA